jgi:hypothetical protein
VPPAPQRRHRRCAAGLKAQGVTNVRQVNNDLEVAPKS